MSDERQESKHKYPNRPQLVAPVCIDESGRCGPTTGHARGPGWRRSSRGLYVPSPVDGESADQRIVEAAAVLPEYGGVTGWAALSWLGGRWFTGTGWGGVRTLPVWLATGGSDIRPQPGIAVSAERLNPRDLIEHDGLAITTAVRSVCFEMRYAPAMRLAVVSLDMAAYDDLVSTDEEQAYANLHSGWTGIPQCREAVPLADENSWSPREIMMRLVWTEDAGLPRPLCNAPVFDLRGGHLGTPDLFDPVAGVVGEYDGALHLQGARRSRDVVREERFRSHGLEYVTMLGGDVRDPGPFIRRLLGAYDRAAAIPGSRRSWTLEQPDWWVDTSTVALRRALSEDERSIWLRHRVARAV
ncbi:MAG: hypothetical protein JWO11_268 [Nocardioides sp.]|nr:hypothetical protein [Nocardioides sp.]